MKGDLARRQTRTIELMSAAQGDTNSILVIVLLSECGLHLFLRHVIGTWGGGGGVELPFCDNGGEADAVAIGAV